MTTKSERIKAIITLVVVFIANILNLYGFQADADAMVQAALMIFAAVTTVYAWWKNNNITKEAVAAQGFLDNLKEENKAEGDE